MKFSKGKWLAYTVLVGLIPVLTRLIAWATTNHGTVNAVSASDFVAFGLVLHISVINELEHLPTKEKEWRSVQNGTAVVFIALYSALYALTIIGEKNSNLIDSRVMLNSSVVFSIVSLLLCLAVFHRLSKLGAR
jgi:membrane-associated PAP2 superfamily phosphatase